MKKIKKIYNRILGIITNPIIYLAAYLWRRLLFKTKFIAITGSVGKTTAKELIAQIFSSNFPTLKTLDSRNTSSGVPRTILKIKPWHRYAIIEVGTDRPGMIRKLSRLVNPDVAIVLAVARTHTLNFKTLENTAIEKAELVKSVKHDGLVLLNAEDERVKQMASQCKCQVKFFGNSNEYDLWATNVSSKWPSRLSFRANTKQESQLVETNLLGEHWVSSIMAALLTAASCGIKLSDAALQIKRVQPFIARMQPYAVPSGATFIRDEFNASPDTFEAAIKMLKESTGVRRILVMSNLSDSSESSRTRLKGIGRRISEFADMAIFIGQDGDKAVKAAINAGFKKENLNHFYNIQEAAQYLKSELGKGDLVLLKGRASDHLSRILFGQIGNIKCWLPKCSKMILCDLCNELKPDFNIQEMIPAELRS